MCAWINLKTISLIAGCDNSFLYIEHFYLQVSRYSHLFFDEIKSFIFLIAINQGLKPRETPKPDDTVWKEMENFLCLEILETKLNCRWR